jgi:hypothetical protein
MKQKSTLGGLNGAQQGLKLKLAAKFGAEFHTVFFSLVFPMRFILFSACSQNRLSTWVLITYQPVVDLLITNNNLTSWYSNF